MQEHSVVKELSTYICKYYASFTVHVFTQSKVIIFDDKIKYIQTSKVIFFSRTLSHYERFVLK